MLWTRRSSFVGVFVRELLLCFWMIVDAFDHAGVVARGYSLIRGNGVGGGGCMEMRHGRRVLDLAIDRSL